MKREGENIRREREERVMDQRGRVETSQEPYESLLKRLLGFSNTLESDR